MYEALAGKRPPVGTYADLAATNEAIAPEIDDLIVKCLVEDREQRLNSLKAFTTQLEGALRPTRPLSEVLSHGKLHELAAAIERYTPQEFAKLPAGQRGLILAKVTDIVGSGDDRLEFAAEHFLRILLITGLRLPKNDYREIVVPAIEWAFQRDFNGRLGKNHIRVALEQAASASDGDAHSVLMEEFAKFLSQVELDEQEPWYFHALREVIEALLANPAGSTDPDNLLDALRRINKVQRSRSSGSWSPVVRA